MCVCLCNVRSCVRKKRETVKVKESERIIDNCSIIIIMPYFIPLAGLGCSKCCRKLGSIKRDIFPPAVHVETGLSSSTLHLCLSAVCLSVFSSKASASMYAGPQMISDAGGSIFFVPLSCSSGKYCI